MIMLSAVIVTGNNRGVAQEVVDALCAQTIAESLEIVIVDTAHRTQSPLKTEGNAKVIRVACDPETSWGAARLAGVQQSSAPVVAFLEDHCIPQGDWAERLVEAHAETWVAVGYSFMNANPQTYLSRATMLSDYGNWEHPVQSGPNLFLQSNNISYKRDALMSLGERLEWLLLSDGVIQEIFRREERPMYLEARARASHYNFTNFALLITENMAHSRAVGAVRARALEWTSFRRLLQGLATPFVAPCFRLGGMMSAVINKPAQRKTFFVSFPILMLSFACAAVGESLGYLLGMGNSASQLTAELLRQGVD
jgi:glycosyltransferase involved in cell wall biosynthesis